MKTVYQLTDHLGNVRSTFDRQGNILSKSDYYPFGWQKPGRQVDSGEKYRYGYQGEYAEEDEETGWNSFEARLYDSRIGRWMTFDPAGQYHSPYMAMGNDPTSTIDPDGRWGSKKKAIKRAESIGLSEADVIEKKGFLGIKSYGFYNGRDNKAERRMDRKNPESANIAMKFVRKDKQMPSNMAYVFEVGSKITSPGHEYAVDLVTGNAYEIYHPTVDGTVVDGKSRVGNKMSLSYTRENAFIALTPDQLQNPEDYFQANTTEGAAFWNSSAIGNKKRKNDLKIKFVYNKQRIHDTGKAKKKEGKRSHYVLNGVCTQYALAVVGEIPWRKRNMFTSGFRGRSVPGMQFPIYDLEMESPVSE